MDWLKLFENPDIVTGLNLVLTYWWAYLPVLLFLAFYFTWQDYIGEEYFNSLNWTLLRIKPPPDVDRSPKAAEQFFSGLHGVFVKPVDWKKKLFKGETLDWFSLEIVGEEGVTNFYIRTLTDYKNLVESNIFAQYPDAEITEVEDYMQKWPGKLPSDEYDLFGSEIILSKEDAYPIQTYPFFEEKMAGLESVKRLDPLSSISEIFSTFRPGEDFVIQVLVRPVGDGWLKKAQQTLDKALGKEPKVEKTFADFILEPIDNLMLGGASAKEEKKEKKLSAPEEEIVKAIGKKMAKIGFETGIRAAYIAKKDVFHRYHFSAIMGTLKQLATANLNSFKVNKTTITYDKGVLASLFPSDKGFFAEKRVFEKKLKFFEKMKVRFFTDKNFILNTEELATVFHLPGVEVKAPLFPRVEAKKGQPPSGLPLE